MAAALNKIAATSPSRQSPSELETSIANALYDLESNIPDMKTALRPLQFVSAREVRPFLFCFCFFSSFVITLKNISNSSFFLAVPPFEPPTFWRSYARFFSSFLFFKRIWRRFTD